MQVLSVVVLFESDATLITIYPILINYEKSYKIGCIYIIAALLFIYYIHV